MKFAETLETELLAAEFEAKHQQNRINYLQECRDECECGAFDDEEDDDEDLDAAEEDDQTLGDQLAADLLNLPATQLSGHQRGVVELWTATEKPTAAQFRELLAIHEACAREAALRGEAWEGAA